jgi:glycosyltransferase involved in cell wall biosynthesis
VLGYQRYRTNGGNLPLVVVGKDIDKYLRGRGFSARELSGIQFMGFIPHEEMVMAYNSAEFFVLTTLYESFGLPLVEAMASGCPAIVRTTGACPEVAGGAARLVHPRDSAAIGDAMAELASSADLRAKMRQAGLERA